MTPVDRTRLPGAGRGMPQARDHSPVPVASPAPTEEPTPELPDGWTLRIAPSGADDAWPYFHADAPWSVVKLTHDAPAWSFAVRHLRQSVKARTADELLFEIEQQACFRAEILDWAHREAISEHTRHLREQCGECARLQGQVTAAYLSGDVGRRTEVARFAQMHRDESHPEQRDGQGAA